MGTPLLRISDGTAKVDLIARMGFTLQDWAPSRLALQDGGVWTQSPFGQGRRLAMYNYANQVDTFTLFARHRSQDTLIRECQNADRLLTKALDYWAAYWPQEPVWLEARAPEETNTRYALIHAYSWPAESNPYWQPFTVTFGTYGTGALTIAIEHGPWQSLPPGQEGCWDVSAQAMYDGVTFGREATGMCVDWAAAGGYLAQYNWPGGSSAGYRFDLIGGGHLLLTPGGSQWGGFCANRGNEANLTDAYYWGTVGGWSGNLIGAATPYNLFPAAPCTTGDYLACGCDVAVADSGPFGSLVFNLSTGAVLGGDSAITWQYSSAAGPTWTSFASANLTDNTDQFQTEGAVSVHFRQPPGWVAAVLNGVTAYWVRALLTFTGGGMTTVPQQDERNVYAIPWAHIQVGSDQCTGDIPSLAHIRAYNVSGDADTTLDFDRLVVGLRSTSRGADFRAHLNCAQGQNPDNVTCVVSTGGAFVQHEEGPAGWCAFFDDIPTLNAARYVEFVFASSATAQWRGAFAAFARVRQRTQTAGYVRFWLSCGSGSGASYVELWAGDWSEPVAVTPTTAPSFELIELGRLNLPPTVPSDVFDQMSLRLGIYNGLGVSVDIDVWDVILIPVDEWSGDFREPVDGLEVTAGRLLEVDSASDPKVLLKAAHITGGGEYTVAPWQPVANGPAIAQANAEQRWWFLGALGQQSEPCLAWAVRLFGVDRYQSMRGAR